MIRMKAILGGAVALLVVGALAVGPATAADKGGPKKSQNVFADAPLAPAQSWSGCGFGIAGGGFMGTLAPSGSPIAIASDAATVGVNGRCALQAGILVFGAEIANDWLYGDLHDLGINRNLTVTGRLGVLPVANTQPYIHGGWAQLSVDKAVFGVNSIDGWTVGAGIEIKLPTSAPLFWDTRYTYSMYDIKDLAGPGVDANSHALRTGLTWQFQMFR